MWFGRRAALITSAATVVLMGVAEAIESTTEFALAARCFLLVVVAEMTGRLVDDRNGPIVLVTLSALRADVVGELGGEPGATPHLDAPAAPIGLGGPSRRLIELGLAVHGLPVHRPSSLAAPGPEQRMPPLLRPLHPAGSPASAGVSRPAASPGTRVLEAGRLRPGIRSPRGSRQGRQPGRRAAGGLDGDRRFVWSISPNRKRPTPPANSPPAEHRRLALPRGFCRTSSPSTSIPRSPCLPASAGGSGRCTASTWSGPTRGWATGQGAARERPVGPYAAGGDLHPWRGVRRKGADPERRQPGTAAPRVPFAVKLPAGSTAGSPCRGAGEWLRRGCGRPWSRRRGESSARDGSEPLRRSPDAVLSELYLPTARTGSPPPGTINSSGSRASRRQGPEYYRARLAQLHRGNGRVARAELSVPPTEIFGRLLAGFLATPPLTGRGERG